MDQKKCTKCGETKPLSEFDWKSKKLQKRKASCKTCRAAYYQKWYEANREVQLKKVLQYNAQHKERNFLFIYNYFLEHPCVDCQVPHPLALVLDHVRGDKRETVGRMACNGC